MSDAPFAIYKIADVAAKLGKSKRWLEDFLRQNPCGRRAGRTRIFTDEDLARLVQMLPRDDLKAGPSFLNQKQGRSARAAGRPWDHTSIEAAELLAKPRCKPPPRPKKKAPADAAG
jgi:hypothetical protein